MSPWPASRNTRRVKGSECLLLSGRHHGPNRTRRDAETVAAAAEAAEVS